jgi:hypothetical protein
VATLLASYTTDWLDLVFRWFHVTAAVVWIGTSFYFVALDNHLREPEREEDRAEGVRGESWEIHGGGFYRIHKFQVAPPRLPKPLHWYKWEAYWTWLSGFALLCIVYYTDARLRLIDPAVADLDPWQAILISLALLVAAWLVYDLVCRLLADRPWPFVIVLVGLVTATAYGVGELYAPRAAYLQVGAMLGTIMAANVLFVIIPGHWELVRAKEAGREPDPRPGILEGALGAQQLPDAARPLHDARRALPVHLHARPRLGRSRRADGRRRRDPRLLQPAPRRRDVVVDSRRVCLRDRRDRDLAASGRDEAGGRRSDRHVRAGSTDRSDAMYALSLDAPDATRLRLAARRCRARHAGPDPRGGPPRKGSGRRLDLHAVQQRDSHDGR